MDRRRFLQTSGTYLLGTLGLPLLLRQAMAAVTAPAPARTLVVIFQRGAVDGLAMVPAIGDAHYGPAIRPTLALGAGDALRLDGFFALHPALRDLLPFWEQGSLAVLHQVGSPDTTRSHFDAQDFMESGTPGVKSTEDGFLNRALLGLPKSSLRAVALQPGLPRSLWGASGAIAMNSIRELGSGNALTRSGSEGGFESMYDGAMDQALRGAGKETFDAIRTLASVPESAGPGAYPKSPLGKRLAEIARLVRAGVGVRLAVTECGGWDTHQRQGAAKGQLATRLDDLGGSIAAFARDLGPKMSDVCVVTMTEFGRTVKENGNGGTDHGHGSVMLALGGGIRGKRVLTRWKSLAVENLHEGRDLPVTTDFRDVWREILAAQLGVRDVARVFPHYAFRAGPGIFRNS